MNTATATQTTTDPMAAQIGHSASDATDHQDDDIQMVSLSMIHKRKNHNPRKTKSAAQRNELRESIRRQNVLQPILVRPHPEIFGDYELVAGETRLDICVELEHPTIPALIRHIADEDLLTAALSENIHRTDMIPTDEGRAAEIMLARYDDRDEVCRILGWTPKKLDARIQLTHCIESVQQALADEQIKLGHAELLSGLREKSQQDGLGMILKAKMSVDDFRTKIEALSLKLAVAPFDLSDCENCPHNSSRQASLFGTRTTAGQCMNKTCFDQKTDEHFISLKDDLAETYPKVGLSDQLAANTTTVLVASGPTGVGTEQLKACTGCEHFGAIIDTRIGNKSHVTENVCFNLTCNKKMVKEYQDIIATDAAPAQPTESASADDKTPASDTKPATKTNAQGKPKAKPVKAAIPATIVDRHHQVHRNTAAVGISTDRKAALIVSVLSMMAEANVKPDSTPEGWPMQLSTDNRAKAAAMLDTLDETKLTALQQQIAAKVLESAKRGDGNNATDAYGSLAVWYAKTRKSDLTAHFTVDENYLKAFVKPAIADILEESGFKAFYIEKHDEKAYKALINGKKGDMIKTALESGFDYTGYLPKALKLTE